MWPAETPASPPGPPPVFVIPTGSASAHGRGAFLCRELGLADPRHPRIAGAFRRHAGVPRARCQVSRVLAKDRLFDIAVTKARSGSDGAVDRVPQRVGKPRRNRHSNAELN